MTRLKLVWRSVTFHARAHLGALFGASVGGAVLIGALVVGDSVRGSLRELAVARLGDVEFAASTGERLFREALGGQLQAGLAAGGLGRPGGVPCAAALVLPGTASRDGGKARANHVQLVGVTQHFWRLAPEPPPFTEVPPDGVVLNAGLARQLGANPGDEILFRVAKPSGLSRDAPLTPLDETTVALRLKVSAVVSERQFGRFGLQASQIAPFNAFISLATLQKRVESPGRANLLLVGELPEATNQAAGVVYPILPPDTYRQRLQSALQQRFQLADAQLEWRDLPAIRALELRSPRVFLDESFTATVLGDAGRTNSLAWAIKRSLPSVRPVGVLTYFVNELRHGDRRTPYSMVSAVEAPLVPADLKEDEILINQWLADDLQAKPGDPLTLRYYAVGMTRELEERTATFTIRSVVPMDAPGWDRDLMPDFPGMTEAENCRDWETGLPIDMEAIRDQDEAYWRDHRGTPKALVSLAAGQKLWSNRYGNLTAVRFYTSGLTIRTPRTPAETQAVQRTLAAIRQPLERAMTRVLDPALFGLRLQPVREQALAAGDQSQDFGALFLGFSFFLIAAALLLMAVLFQFAIEQRTAEVGALLAIGFSPRRVRGLLLSEGAAVALAGIVIGLGGGILYARAMVAGLSTIWNQAVGGASLGYHATDRSLLIGAVAAWLVAVGTMGLALRRQAARPARELMAEGDLADLSRPATGRPRRSHATGIALTAGALAVGLLVWGVIGRPGAAAGQFFGAGALLLIAGLAAASRLLTALDAGASSALPGLRELGLRGATRRRRRSLATMALLACGAFLILSIGVFRLDTPDDGNRRDSGTGGFALIGSATQPVLEVPTGPAGIQQYGLDEARFAGVDTVPFRVQDGDEASCLNLNRAQAPRVMGVDPEALAKRGAFRFVTFAKGLPAALGWQALSRERCLAAGLDLAEDEVPAVGDQASIQYALGRKVGDCVPFTDSQGRTFQLRLVGAVANSILQGSLIVDRTEFVERFPDAAGYRWFLIDAPRDTAAKVAEGLSRALVDEGLEITRATDRLAAFNAVQNTYLGTFQILGGLGLGLGSLGLGAVVLRNVLERRGELALLLALGFRRPTLRRLILVEHLALLAGGLGIGAVAALVAVFPTVWTTGLTVPVWPLTVTLLAVLGNGALWTWAATQLAIRGNLLTALRNT